MELPDTYRHTLDFLKQNDNMGVIPMLQYVCEVWKQQYQESSANCMASVPRRFEKASDDAARADVYKHFVDELLKL